MHVIPYQPMLARPDHGITCKLLKIHAGWKLEALHGTQLCVGWCPTMHATVPLAQVLRTSETEGSRSCLNWDSVMHLPRPRSAGPYPSGMQHDPVYNDASKAEGKVVGRCEATVTVLAHGTAARTC